MFSAQPAGAVAVVSGVIRLTLLLPGLGELAAAHRLERRCQLATAAHRLEDRDRLVEPADRDSRRVARVCWTAGTSGRSAIACSASRERAVRIAAGLERAHARLLSHVDALRRFQRVAVEPRQDALGRREPTRRDVAPARDSTAARSRAEVNAVDAIKR